MIRVLCLVGGVAGAAGLSQFPEFSQQYIQRLAGQVDALTVVVMEFDASALAAGMGREEALQDLSGSDFQLRHQADMRAMFARHARLSDNLMALQAASPLRRLVLPHRMTDGPTLQEVWSDYTPAMPISGAGVVAAGAGFVGGWAVLAAILGTLAMPFRRRNTTGQPAPKRREPRIRADPQVSRPTLVAQTRDNRPRLAGAQR